MAELPEGLPSSVRVGFLDYAIEPWSVIHAMDAQRFGECAHQALAIRIDFSHPYRKNAHTLLHEIMHAVCRVYAREDKAEEEKTVEIMSNGLAGVWRDNPAVFAWIARGLTDGPA